jgi:hypothetical protein
MRLEADRPGQEVGVLAQPIAGALDLDDGGMVKECREGPSRRRRLSIDDVAAATALENLMEYIRES